VSYNSGNALDYYIRFINTKSEFNGIEPCKQERDTPPILNFHFFPLGLSGPGTPIWFGSFRNVLWLSKQRCAFH